jgi:hypothetical protein
LDNGGKHVLPWPPGAAQVIGIILFHQTLAQVVYVQVVIMAALFVSLLWWNFGHRAGKERSAVSD